MKLKKIMAIGIAVILSFIMSIPAFAKVTRIEPGELLKDMFYIYTDNGYDIEYPCWIWANGYCYYYQNSITILKDTITPDGYMVDSEGRWTVNGIPQSNGYGHYTMGTDEYIGKSDDEIWNLMKAKLEPVYSNAISSGGGGATAYTAKDSIAYGIAYGGTTGNEITVTHNNDYYHTFVDFNIGGYWPDMANDTLSAYGKAYLAQEADIKEKTIKALIGDKIGQELFEYIRPEADKTSPGYVIVPDKDGNPIMGWWDRSINDDESDKFIFDPNGSDEYAMLIDNAGDGMSLGKLDFSSWQNRTTDYGKRFSVIYDRGAKIYIYN